MRGEAVGNADGPEAGVTAGFHVDVRVADDYRFFRLDADFLQ
jgi:hypothetical protein